MGLIYCSMCGAQISDAAPQCPKCGYVFRQRRIKSSTTPNARPVQGLYGQPSQRANYRPQQLRQPGNGTTVIVNQNPSNGMGTAGFVFALLSFLVSWVPVVGFIVWFLGFVFSFIGIFKSPRGLAIAGLILSLIDFIFLIVVIGWIVNSFSNSVDSISNIVDFFSQF